MFGYCAIVADHRRTKKAKADDKGINVTEDDLKIVLPFVTSTGRKQKRNHSRLSDIFNSNIVFKKFE